MNQKQIDWPSCNWIPENSWHDHYYKLPLTLSPWYLEHWCHYYLHERANMKTLFSKVVQEFFKGMSLVCICQVYLTMSQKSAHSPKYSRGWCKPNDQNCVLHFMEATKMWRIELYIRASHTELVWGTLVFDHSPFSMGEPSCWMLSANQWAQAVRLSGVWAPSR